MRQSQRAMKSFVGFTLFLFSLVDARPTDSNLRRILSESTDPQPDSYYDGPNLEAFQNAFLIPTHQAPTSHKSFMGSIWDNFRFMAGSMFDCHLSSETYILSTSLTIGLNGATLVSGIANIDITKTMWAIEQIYLSAGVIRSSGTSYSFRTRSFNYLKAVTRNTAANTFTAEVDWTIQFGGSDWPSEVDYHTAQINADNAGLVAALSVYENDEILSNMVSYRYACGRDDQCP